MNSKNKVPSFTDFVGAVKVEKPTKRVDRPEPINREHTVDPDMDSGIIGVLERFPIEQPGSVEKPELPYDKTYVDRLKKKNWESEPVQPAVEEPQEAEVLEQAEELEPEQPEVREPEPDPEIEPINESIKPEFEGYRIIRDRDETFECKISVEGTTLTEARARLVLDSEPWNLTFYGKIYPDGRCVVPIKKGFPLGEGSMGKIRLEVIAEDQLFVGWESDFLVEVSKKLSVQLKEQKKVKVSFGKEE